MTVVSIASGKDLRRLVRGGVTLVDFYAKWCAPCRVQSDILKQLSEHLGGKATIARMDLDRHRKTAVDLNIRNIPTLILFRDGTEISRMVGLQSEQTIAAAIARALERRMKTESDMSKKTQAPTERNRQ